MKIVLKIALLTSALALAGGGAAFADMPVYGEPPQGEPPHGPKAGPPPKGKAYGFFCKGESKKHVKGEKGTEFSRCVKNMAQAAKHQNMAPGRVCKGESKKHEKGEKGTDFSRCVKDVVELRRQKREEEAAAAV